MDGVAGREDYIAKGASERPIRSMGGDDLGSYHISIDGFLGTCSYVFTHVGQTY